MALLPGPSPFATAAALRTFGAVGLIAVFGALLGHLQSVGVAYFGAACAAAFTAAGGLYRARLWALSAQAAGAATGLVAGVSLPTAPPWLICAAVIAGMVSGLVGAVGPNTPGFGMMISVGLAFGQFSGARTAWWEQALWYLVGTAVVAMATLSPWFLRAGTVRRRTIAEVFFAAAELCSAIGTDAAPVARRRLTAASAAGRSALHYPRADLVAYAAATLYAQGQPVPDDAIEAIRTAGANIRAGHPVETSFLVPADDPGSRALADALGPHPSGPGASVPSRARRMRAVWRAATTSAALANSVRVGLCMGVATALTVALHETSHAFWLPMTVAAIVRPEYGSVFVRTVNRVCGTVLGALAAAAVLAVQPSGLGVAVAATFALSCAVLTAPKLYAFSVIGVTASALLSSAIGGIDPVQPGLRLLDTVLGAVVALVFGYLLWPSARRLPAGANLEVALTAAQDYLVEARAQPTQRKHWQITRDDAYRLVHQVRVTVETAVAEPPPVSILAVKMLPAAMELEAIVDAITAVAAATDTGQACYHLINAVEQRLTALATYPRHSPFHGIGSGAL